MPSPPARRRRASRRRILVRRAGALVVLAVVAFGTVRLVGALASDGDGAVASSDGSTAGDAAPGDSVAPSTPGIGADVGGSEAPDTAAPAPSVPPTAPEHTGPPSAAAPAQVLIVGDSDAGTFGPYLQQLLRQTGVVQTELDYKVSSGLARPDFFDWHAELERIVPAVDPEIVVVTFGGNDGQFLADDSGGAVATQPRPDADNAAWTTEYRARVARVLDFLVQDGRTVIWVGIPNHVDPEVTFRMQLQDQAVKAEIAERPDVLLVDTWTRFAGRSGNFAPMVIDPRDGQGKSVRADDGFHLNQTGAEILAIDISQVIFADLRERGAAI